MFKKFNFENLKPMNTPMSTSIKLDKDENDTSIDRYDRIPSSLNC